MSLIIDVLLVCWAVFLVYKGLSRKEGWFGWLMFSRARYFSATLRDRNGVVDVWEYLPHCQVMLSQLQIEELLRFIQTKRLGGYITGTVTLYNNDHIHEYSVRKNLLIPKS